MRSTGTNKSTDTKYCRDYTQAGSRLARFAYLLHGTVRCISSIALSYPNGAGPWREIPHQRRSEQVALSLLIPCRFTGFFSRRPHMSAFLTRTSISRMPAEHCKLQVRCWSVEQRGEGDLKNDQHVLSFSLPYHSIKAQLNARVSSSRCG
jgi:hypothetical protein